MSDEILQYGDQDRCPIGLPQAHGLTKSSRRSGVHLLLPRESGNAGSDGVACVEGHLQRRR